MISAAVDADRLWQSIMDMAEIGATSDGGSCRLALSPEDAAARALLLTWCKPLGLRFEQDAIGNMFLRREGTNAAAGAIALGSHLDTVPTGGRFDGVFGVLAALEVIRALHEAGLQTKASLELVNWTNEEGSRFKPAMMGSRVFARDMELGAALATTDDNGVSVARALRDSGQAGPLVPSPRGWSYWLEGHIEQGPVRRRRVGRGNPEGFSDLDPIFISGSNLNAIKAPPATDGCLDETGQPAKWFCERDVPVKMRDGTALRCDVWRPRANGRVPALLQRQPYDKRMAQSYVYAHPGWYARHGYGVVVQDSRGRGSSEGDFYPLRGDAADGVDTIAWCAEQPWCSGKVASYGFSLPGLNQLLAASERPAALVTAIPGFYPQGIYDGLTHVGGAFGLAAVLNWALLLAPDAARRAGKPELLNDIRDASACGGPPSTLALKDMPFLLKPDLMPFLRDYLEHPAFGPYWREFELGQRLSDVTIPCLHLSGWYDSFVTQTLNAYERFTTETNADHRLLVGPWYHIPWTQQVGAVDFGDDARNFVDEYQLAWLDFWTKGRHGAFDALPPVRVFVTGSNVWHDAERWPLPATKNQTWYLRSKGRANSLSGNGTFTREQPDVNEPADYYFYDPANPVQSLGGHSCCYPQAAPMGPMIQREVELRNDVLIYTSEPLERPLWVAGKVMAKLFAATTARDTDWVVKLCDVAPDGRSLNIQEGVIRARFRSGLEQAELIEPDSVNEYTITVGACCHSFAAGHRIRIQVTSSNFPGIDRNPNTGGPLGMENAFEWVPASQTVLHDAARPSRIILPIMSD